MPNLTVNIDFAGYTIRVSAERRFQLIAGNLCLDFLNTLDNRGDPWREEELLATYADLLSFLRQSGALPHSIIRKLAALSVRDPDEANETLLRTRQLREALQRIFMATIRKRAPNPSDVDEVNAMWTRVSQYLLLQPGTGGFYWQWDDEAGIGLDRALCPILRAATALLTSDDLVRVRACESEECQWLFLDTSRNHSRRWCEMRICGNRSKVRRFYERHHATGK